MTDFFLLHRLQNHQFFLGVSGSRAVWEPMTDWQVNWLSMTGELTDWLVLKMLPHLKISWNLTIWPLRVRLVTEWSNAKQGWETEGSVAKNTSGVKPRFTYHRWHLCDTGYHTYKQFKYHFEDGLRLESTYIWFLKLGCAQVFRQSVSSIWDFQPKLYPSRTSIIAGYLPRIFNASWVIFRYASIS